MILKFIVHTDFCGAPQILSGVYVGDLLFSSRESFFFFRGCFLYLKPKVSAKVKLTTVLRSETSKVTHFANPQFNPKHMQGKRSFPQHLYHQKDKMNNPHRKLCA